MSLPAERALARAIEGGELTGGTLFVGSAGRLRDEGLRRFVDAALDPATRDFNYSVFEGGSADPETLASALAMPPMMAPRRVVVLTEAERTSPTVRKQVVRALERLPGDVAFVISATVPDRSKAAFYRDLRKLCRTFEWSRPKPGEVPGWAIERARERHRFDLSPRAAQALAAAVGPDLSILDAELAKLGAAAEGGEVDLDLARTLLPQMAGSVDRWTWLDGVAERRYAEALGELDALLASDSAVGLVAAMVEQHLFLGLALEGGAGTARKALEETGKPYLRWKAPVYARQARGWRAAEIGRALRLMRRADERLKRGGGEREVLQELLLCLRVAARAVA